MGDTITKRALLTVHRHAEGVRLDLRVPKTKTTLMHVIPLRAAMSLQPPLTPPLDDLTIDELEQVATELP